MGVAVGAAAAPGASSCRLHWTHRMFVCKLERIHGSGPKQDKRSSVNPWWRPRAHVPSSEVPSHICAILSQKTAIFGPRHPKKLFFLWPKWPPEIRLNGQTSRRGCGLELS